MTVERALTAFWPGLTRHPSAFNIFRRRMDTRVKPAYDGWSKLRHLDANAP
jgi:hypothetical protein